MSYVVVVDPDRTALFLGHGGGRECGPARWDHNATLHTIYRSFGDVRPVAEVIRMLDGDCASSDSDTES